MTDETGNSDSNGLVVLITGGSGFLGQRIVEELLSSSSLLPIRELRVFDIKPYSGSFQGEVSFIEGDVRNIEQLEKACANVSLVIHAAAVIDWGVKDDAEVLAINVDGTRNVIAACRAHKVEALVYTSSLDAVYTGRPLRNIDESQPYPDKHVNAYCQSKREGEELVLDANSQELKTIVLRPSDIYGEADPYHIDPLIDMAKSGFYVRLGNGQSKCQHVYVGNMAHAHVLAAKALLEGNSAVCGNPYFITDGKGSNFFTFFDQVVRGAGYAIKPKNFWLPKWIAYPMAALTEFGAWIIRPLVRVEVKFSRFAVNYTCNDFTFTAQRAMKDFGFTPKYSTAEGIQRTASYYRETSKND